MRLTDADKLLELVDCMKPIHGIGLEPVVAVGTVRDLITDAQTIDAIPVEWLEDKMFNSTKEVSVAAWRVLNEWHPHDVQAWQNEQEAR